MRINCPKARVSSHLTAAVLILAFGVLPLQPAYAAPYYLVSEMNVLPYNQAAKSRGISRDGEYMFCHRGEHPASNSTVTDSMLGDTGSGAVVDLPSSEYGTVFVPRSMNRSGTIVGMIRSDGAGSTMGGNHPCFTLSDAVDIAPSCEAGRAAIVPEGLSYAIPLPVPGMLGSSRANAINNLGVIAGYGERLVEGEIPWWEAAIWWPTAQRSSEPTDLSLSYDVIFIPRPPEILEAKATGINDSNMVVGMAKKFNGTSYRMVGFFFHPEQHSVMQLFDFGSQNKTLWPRGITNSGIVFGARGPLDNWSLLGGIHEWPDLVGASAFYFNVNTGSGGTISDPPGKLNCGAKGASDASTLSATKFLVECGNAGPMAYPNANVMAPDSAFVRQGSNGPYTDLSTVLSAGYVKVRGVSGMSANGRIAADVQKTNGIVRPATLIP